VIWQALANLVANLSQLASLSRIAEAEINPVLVQTDGVLMLDALIRIQPQPMSDSALS
jgi:succinyl-CoA synthetase beta subunit